MALTLSVTSLIITNVDDADSVIQTWARAVTTNHIYGFTCVPISNTESRLVMIYD